MVRFHLEDKVPTASVDICRVKHTGIRLKFATSLGPPRAIKGAEVIPPMELKLIVRWIVIKHLHIVVKDVPWHINWVESDAPSVECGCPEVHPQRLRLIEVLNSCTICRMFRMGEAYMAHLVAVDNPRHVVRRPLHLVYMPIIPWVESFSLVVRLHLALKAISINHVHLEWIVSERRHNLKVKLVPTIGC